MAADIQGLMADTQFQSLAPADKRAVLAGVTGDKSFSGLGDAETLQFVSGVTDRARVTRPDLFPPPSVPNPRFANAQQQSGPNMQMSPLGRDPNITPITPQSLITGAAQDVKNLSVATPIQRAVQQATGKPILGQPPSGAEITQSAVNVAPGMVLAGMEGPEVKPNPNPQLPQPAQAADTSPSLARIASRHIPIIGRFLRMGDTINEIQKYVERGKAKGKAAPEEPVYPGAPLPLAPEPAPYPATPTPELRQSGGLATGGRPAPPEPSAGLGMVPVRTSVPTEAEAGTSVPVGKFTKEVPNPDPYQFSGAPKTMEIVQSTNVGKVGYNPDAKVMTVEYKNGFVYSYHGVPQEIYQGAKDSESIGSYISRNVKGRYETVRRGSVLVKKSQ